MSGALLMTWLDVVIDPLTVHGDRWFLGRIYYYPEGGAYFGVPLAISLGGSLWASPRYDSFRYGTAVRRDLRSHQQA